MINQEIIEKETITCSECGTESVESAGCNNCGIVYNFLVVPIDKCYHCGDEHGKYYGMSEDPAPYGLVCEPCSKCEK